VSVSMSEVEHAIANAQGFAGRMHVAQPNHDGGNRSVWRDLEGDDGRPRISIGPVERSRVEDDGAVVVLLLIASLIAFATKWTHSPACLPRVKGEHTPRGKPNGRVPGAESIVGHGTAVAASAQLAARLARHPASRQCSWRDAGLTLAVITRAAWVSSMMPVSDALQQWSHHRSIS